MILVCRPKGRGNWATTVFAIEGAHVSPMLVRVGTTFTLGGIVWRICRVEP